MSETSTFNIRFCDTYEAYRSSQDVVFLEATLADLTCQLLDPNLRISVGSAKPDIWPSLRELWLQINTPDTICYEESLSKRTLSVAKFTRNLVAGCPPNQEKAFENAASMYRLLYQCSSFIALQEEAALVIARMLVQAISNMVTSNANTAKSFWLTVLEMTESQNVLLRLLESPDARLLYYTFTLIHNSISASEALGISILLRPENHRLCIAVLDGISRLSIEDEKGDAERAFTIGYNLVEQLITERHLPTLYKKLAVQDEAIAPHQITMLKLLDAHLQNVPIPDVHHDELVSMLAALFLEFAVYTQHAVRQSLGPNATTKEVPGAEDSAPLRDLDLLLPKVCEALILTVQCLITIAMQDERTEIGPPRRAEAMVNAAHRGPQGSIEILIETLQLLALFLPRIIFGKPVSETGQPHPPETNLPSRTADPTGFAFVKRDLVRLLGILCHDDRAVQDRVRQCEGIPVVMNLCTLDERNPYIREHSIFTLNNLLKNNLENQAVVDEIKLMGSWDDRIENGERDPTDGR